MTARRVTLADLPLYADDMAIGAAVLGPERAGEWRDMTPLLERDGLPKIDPFYGLRYVPAVKRFYDMLNGIEPVVPLAPKGVEDPSVWDTRKPRQRRAV